MEAIYFYFVLLHSKVSYGFLQTRLSVAYASGLAKKVETMVTLKKK
jgi:hypothetical protein